MNQEVWTVETADEYLNSIPKFSSEKHSADALRGMLIYMDAMPRKEKIIHVAGTNGKGSVCSFLDSILQKSGRHTARFTSPHLVRVTERFSFDGENVDDDLFLEAFETVKSSYIYFENAGFGHPTYFEFLFLMFMWMLRQKESEYVILETGLGGRLDATNCIEHPVLTIITSISLDHMEYLGDTVSKIAAEKAGILKEGVPVVYDDTDSAASAVIRDRAGKLSCSSFPINQEMYTDLTYENGGMSLVLREEKPITIKSDDMEYTPSNTNGAIKNRMFIPFEAEYQAINACIAYRAARILGIDSQMAMDGIKNAIWRGRMEKIEDGVYLDGAHNEGGIRAFVKAAYEVAVLRKENCKKQGRIFLLFAAVSDKNYESMLEMLIKKLKPEYLILTHLATTRALPIEKMKDAAQKIAERENCGCDIRCIADVKAAYHELIQKKRAEDTCFCVGSLYLIGELEDLTVSS